MDARKTEHLRMIQNLGKEKSDQEDASILASTARLDAHAISKGHERLPESGLTRLLEQLKRNACKRRYNSDPLPHEEMDQN